MADNSGKGKQNGHHTLKETSCCGKSSDGLDKEWTVQMTFVDNLENHKDGDGTPYLNSDGEDEEDEITAHNAEDENGLEPPHCTIWMSITQHLTWMWTMTWSGIVERQSWALSNLYLSLPIWEAWLALYTQRQTWERISNMGFKLALFASQLDWEVAKWDKMCGPSSSSFTELMSIDGGICALFKDLDVAPYLKLVPERHSNDEDREERVYHNMYTGTWWWSMQTNPAYSFLKQVHVFNLHDNWQHMEADPLLSPNNQPGARDKKAKRKHRRPNLYHACLQHILQPLATAGTEGAFMSTATGNVHQFIGDYPEQVLTACMLNGDCPRCGTTRDNLGDFNPDNMPAPHSMDDTQEVFEPFQLDPAGFLQAYSQICAKPSPPILA
ncbi:hypothetical protein EI94DRAFT_1704770 [Lactarius quietus]|nr:hypothetical protein EI94DRAFT_1704770 [Lactarius quietus]